MSDWQKVEHAPKHPCPLCGAEHVEADMEAHADPVWDYVCPTCGEGYHFDTPPAEDRA